MHPHSASFTTVSTPPGLLRSLKNRCGISVAYDLASSDTPPTIGEFDAIWDTGATGSVITQNVVDACGLSPVSMMQVHGVNSSDMSEVYLVNIYLPNKVVFIGVPVTKGGLPNSNFDILIGMDMINQGDFAVTNKGGVTKFSFRYPSEADIDFVKEHHKKKTKRTTKKRRKKNPKTFGKNKK